MSRLNTFWPLPCLLDVFCPNVHQHSLTTATCVSVLLLHMLCYFIWMVSETSLVQLMQVINLSANKPQTACLCEITAEDHKTSFSSDADWVMCKCKPAVVFQLLYLFFCHLIFSPILCIITLCHSLVQKHEQQAQQHFQQQLRRRREEEEVLHRQAELQAEARQDSDYHKADAQHQHHHDKASSGKLGDKPKRPSSLLGNNNVMKLKQIIPLQGKFSSGTSRSPAQSPTGGEAKLPGFLKFLKSPEVKKEPVASVVSSPPSSVTSSAPPSGQERSQSPNRTFSPGKLFSFSKSEGTVVCVNGTQHSPASAKASRADSSGTQEELPSNESDKGESRPSADLENSGSKS